MCKILLEIVAAFEKLVEKNQVQKFLPEFIIEIISVKWHTNQGTPIKEH